MKIKDKELWDKCLASNGNGEMTDYGGAVLWFAEHWADAMEARIDTGEKLEDIADATSHEIDVQMGQYGITGFQYGAAVSTLAECWEYGEQLRVWHNREYGVESDTGVVNPAIVTASTGEED